MPDGPSPGSSKAAAEWSPRSLIWATDIDVLPASRVVERRDGYLVVRSPSNPTHWWGNFLLFDEAPDPGDGASWERIFAAELPEARHRAFGWDRADGVAGAAEAELGARGFELERVVGLIAAPSELRPHARENAEVSVRALDAVSDADDRLWDAVLGLQVAGRDPQREDERSYSEFSRAWLRDQRELMAGGHGAWYVAVTPDGEVAGSCGVIVTGTRGRFRAVDTAHAHRRRGISSRLVVAAGQMTAERYGAEQLVIVADADYHALGLYESLGFVRREQTWNASLRPPAS